ncbi:MAG: hypothetical protein KDE33_11990 [Bacteroidetes bacterium]|nr:hypothetical protein [Bacteroidota bacterium]
MKLRFLPLIIILFSFAWSFAQTDEVPTMSEDELNDFSKKNKNYSRSLLLDFRDIYANQAQWNMGGESFFSRRGINREYNDVWFLGMPAKDLENGLINYNIWGGLNLVINNKGYNTNGLYPSTFGYTGVGTSQYIDPRPHTQYDGFNISYANSNRNYNHRLMASYNSGFFGKGWAVSLAASKRYAESGFIEGTPYDAYSYYGAVEKRFGLKHSLTLTVLGSNLKRGKLRPATKEYYDLAGSNLANPNWGEYDGVQRNRRMVHQHLPMGALTYEYNSKNNKLKWTTSAAAVIGRYGETDLDWYDAADPRPDYYRYLPSYALSNGDTALYQTLTEEFRNNPDLLQLNWYNLYEANMNPLNSTTYHNMNVDGEIKDITGNRAKYLVVERREDEKKFNFSSTANIVLSRKIDLSIGVDYINQNKHFYQVAKDLLGADFHINYNQFAERATPDQVISGLDTIRQHDVDNPNRIVYEGDKYGYDYNASTQFADLWGTLDFNFRKIDFFVQPKVSFTSFYRKGNNRNGLFLDDSYGKSEVQNFLNYGVKAGATIKINGRNFIVANGIYETKAPLFANAFVSNRTRNQVVNDLKSEIHFGGEAGYVLRSDRVYLNFMGYYLQLRNLTELNSFYHDQYRTFVNYSLTGIDRQHMGLELAFKVKVLKWLNVFAATNLGKYTYISRPNAMVTIDNNSEVISNETVYWKNYHVANTPEFAATGGIGISHAGFFLNINANYTARNWIDINPVRRTALGLDLVPEGEQRDAILDQEMYDNQFSLDLFTGYTWYLNETFDKMKKSHALAFNLGVSNLTNNKNFIAIGFENNRFDFENKDINKFQNKYFYGNGINYFASVTYRF